MGDKVGLLQEKGDKSITLAKISAIGVPLHKINIFCIKNSVLEPIPPLSHIYFRMGKVQFFVLLGVHFNEPNHKIKIYSIITDIYHFKKIVP